jgi:hypothetical protein
MATILETRGPVHIITTERSDIRGRIIRSGDKFLLFADEKGKPIVLQWKDISKNNGRLMSRAFTPRTIHCATGYSSTCSTQPRFLLMFTAREKNTAARNKNGIARAIRKRLIPIFYEGVESLDLVSLLGESSMRPFCLAIHSVGNEVAPRRHLDAELAVALDLLDHHTAVLGAGLPHLVEERWKTARLHPVAILKDEQE